MSEPSDQVTSEPTSPSAGAAQLGLFAAVALVLVAAVVRAPQGELSRPSPFEDALVVAHVAPRRAPETRQLEQLARAAHSDPDDLDRTLLLARAHIEAARRDGDPRELGAAEAALAPFLERPVVAAPALVLQATLLQARHDFPEALRVLDAALAQRPDDAQAWLTRATVLTVLGRYEEAEASCSRLSRLSSPAIRTGCSAPIAALTGRGEQAASNLAFALARARTRNEQAYLSSLLGELTYWAGDTIAGERQLRAALALDDSDRYTRAVLADLLLDTRRPLEAMALVLPYGADDALALRAAIAAHALGERDASARAKRLDEGYAASRLRGDFVHQREQARLALVRGESARALALALESWSLQREPWDARLVLEAAVAVGANAAQRKAAAPVLTWLRRTQFRAPRLSVLAATLEAAS
jgi:Flp pilus assembly protein TadD